MKRFVPIMLLAILVTVGCSVFTKVETLVTKNPSLAEVQQKELDTLAKDACKDPATAKNVIKGTKWEKALNVDALCAP